MQYDDDPNYWWLRLQYALRDGRQKDADEARQNLARLGYAVDLQPSAVRLKAAGKGVSDAR